MERIIVYDQIQEYKRKGFSKKKTSEMLGLCWRTVDKYWDMTLPHYEELENGFRKGSTIEEHTQLILTWLNRYPDMSSAQIYDWLQEHYGDDIKVSERTLRRYVADLRKTYAIERKPASRDYAAVPDMPLGQQMQVDFGESWMEDVNGRRVKVRAANFILSASRYRFCTFQSRPFTSRDLVNALRQCFAYMGGRTREIVFDQDSVVSVSENAGDIILTREMALFKMECGFSIYLCRGADPESKGKIENGVKFLKNNFIPHRMYPGSDDELNDLALRWLERTGNRKAHGTTKRSPADFFKEELPHLVPHAATAVLPKLDCRNVRKDNTIVYLSNRYSLPLGTYNATREVHIDATDSKLTVYSPAGDVLCFHTISPASGVLVQKSTHRHDRTTKADRLKAKLVGLLGKEVEGYLTHIEHKYPRYVCEQLSLLQHAYGEYGRETLTGAIEYLGSEGIVSANSVCDYAKTHQTITVVVPKNTAIPADYPSVAKRDIAAYAEVM